MKHLLFFRCSLLVFAVLALLAVSNTVRAQSNPRPVPPEWITYAEKTGYRETPRYQETVDYAKKLADGSPLIRYFSAGRSSEGREIPLLVAAEGGDFDPASARKAGKAVILIQAAIHAGESDGKDAGFALLRDIALFKDDRALLKDTVVLFIPIYNVDGHELFSKYNRINQNGPEEMGFRANSANQNLNRDYMKADTHETRSWLTLWNIWSPDIFIDCHVTDGADFQYNITWEYARHQEAPAPLKAWMDRHYLEKVVPETEEYGDLLSPYIQLADRNDLTRGMFTFIATPRFATGYTPLRNRIGLLIEAHSLKPYKSRVRGTYDLLKSMIAEVSASKDSLIAANGEADRLASERGKTHEDFPLSLRLTREPTSRDFKGVSFTYEDSYASGGKKLVYGSDPVNVTIPWYDTTQVSASVKAPTYYIVPAEWFEVIERLSFHGIGFERLNEAREIEVESYRFEDPKWASAPFEGRITLTAKAVEITEMRLFPKGSAVVPVSQPASAVLIHLLEPDGPDSLFYWGFFNAIFERKEYGEAYALEALASEMLAGDPKLKAEFEEKLKDENFAKNPRARLNFFYDRSGYKERLGVYPVGRVSRESL